MAAYTRDAIIVALGASLTRRGKQLEQTREEIEILEFEARVGRDRFNSVEQTCSSLTRKVASLEALERSLKQQVPRS